MGIGRNSIGRSRLAFGLRQSFVIAKEEGLVFLDRSADGAAILMAVERRDDCPVKKVPGVECAVAVEIVSASVKLVGARLGDRVDYATGAPPVFGRIIIG